MSRIARREKTSAQRSPLRKDRSSSRGQDLHRPLLPCPQLLISSSSPSPVKQAVSTSNADLRPARNNVTLACNECKAKKAKCDGNDSCSRCTSKGLQCLFDQSRDRRRVRGMPAENTVLREKISQYERLFNSMYMTPAKEAVRVLHILRSCSIDFQHLPDCGDGLPLDELLQLVEEVQQGVTGSPDSYHDAARSTGSLSSFNSGHLSRLNATSGSSTGNTSLSPTSPVDYHLHNSKMASTHSIQQQSPNPISPSSQHGFHQSDAERLGSPNTSSPATETGEVKAVTNWPAYVRTDLKQVTTWLNQDMDNAANALNGRHS